MRTAIECGHSDLPRERAQRFSDYVAPTCFPSVHADHLNTPRLVADATGTTVWRWDQQEPFGNNPADENPSGLGAFDLPLRLPGQYFDKETNLHYNYFRDYDPILGKYLQSDPIGLEAGLNTYAYVLGNPINFTDPSGLAGWSSYIGGLVGKAAGPAAEGAVKKMSEPGNAGNAVATGLCSKYSGGAPRDLFNDCTTGCLAIVEKIQAISKAAGGWLDDCIAACKKEFPKCNKRPPQSEGCPGVS